jgi:DivIVA domain-containing protein
MSSPTSGDWPGRTGPVTPQEIRSAAFHPSPMAWRGYAPQEVKQLLDAAADSLHETQEESVGLEAEVERLRNFYRTHSAEAIAAAPPLGLEGHGLLGSLRAYAPAQVQQACDYADQVIDQVIETDRVLKHARVRTSIVVEEAAERSAQLPPARGGGPTDIEQSQLWIRFFAHALRTYTSTVYDTIAGALARASGASPPRPYDPRRPPIS